MNWTCSDLYKSCMCDLLLYYQEHSLLLHQTQVLISQKPCLNGSLWFIDLCPHSVSNTRTQSFSLAAVLPSNLPRASTVWHTASFHIYPFPWRSNKALYWHVYSTRCCAPKYLLATWPREDGQQHCPESLMSAKPELLSGAWLASCQTIVPVCLSATRKRQTSKGEIYTNMSGRLRRRLNEMITGK